MCYHTKTYFTNSPFMTHAPKGNRGIIKMVLVIVIALIVLGFFGYNLRDIIDSPTVKENLAYVWGLVVKFWNAFLAAPAEWLWDKIQEVLAKKT